MKPTPARIFRAMIPNRSQLTALAALGRHPRGGKKALAAFQNRRLRQLVAHAYAHVPYYRQLFDQVGLKPGDIRTTADLSLVPMSTKKDYQVRPPRDKLARGYCPEKLLFFQTSGSTGEPMTIWRTWFEERLLSAFRQRARHSFGMRTTDRVTRITLKRDHHHNDHQQFSMVFNALGLYNHSIIDCTQSPRSILKELQKQCPDIIAGYPGTLVQVGDCLDADDLRVPRPRFLITGAEPLLLSMRRQIEKTFKAPVYDMYGSWEFNLLAWECRETGKYHVCDDSVILEIIKDGRPANPGESGEVVCTGLHSFIMPFIRFRMGDVATRGNGTCSCGSPFSTIMDIQGRTVDYFILPNGRLISPMTMMAKGVGKVYHKVRQVQMIQERQDRIVINIVPASEKAKTWIEKTLALSLPEFLGPDVSYEVVFLAEIAKEPNGKYVVMKSQVAGPDSLRSGAEWE